MGKDTPTRPLAYLGRCSGNRPKEAERNDRHVQGSGYAKDARGGGPSRESRAAGVSEPTVRKRLKPQGPSPKMPVKAKGPSVADEYSATDGL